MSNWLGINAEYDPPRKISEGFCKAEGDAYNNAKTAEETSIAKYQLQKCFNVGFAKYDSEHAKRQEMIDLAVLGGTTLVAVIVLVIIAKQWDRISATAKQFRIDFEAARMMRAKDKQRDKADFARKVQERLNELEKQREG